MAKQKLSKTDLLEKMTGHVLTHGLNTASLRPLAQAAGTSDRMLIYHFSSKDALIGELLAFMSEQLAEGLTTALPNQRAASNAACLAEIVGLLRKEPYAGFMRIWLDILSEAGQGNAAHRQTGHAMIEGYVAWLSARLPKGTRDPDATIALMLTVIEGVLVLDTVGQSDLADRAVAAAFQD